MRVDGWRTVTGEVERLPGGSGWHVLRLDHDDSADLAPLGRLRRGFVPVTAAAGGATWDTSLMPMGDGTLFLALPSAVRRAADIADGDEVSARFRLRSDAPAAPAVTPRGRA